MRDLHLQEPLQTCLCITNQRVDFPNFSIIATSLSPSTWMSLMPNKTDAIIPSLTPHVSATKIEVEPWKKLKLDYIVFEN